MLPVDDQGRVQGGGSPGERVEMTRWPDTLRFYGSTSAAVQVIVELEQNAWVALGSPDTFVIRVR